METESGRKSFEEQPVELKNEKERSEFFDRLKTIIQTISGKKNLKVSDQLTADALVGLAAQGLDPEKTWFREEKINSKTGKKEEYVHIPYEITEKEDVAKGKAAHEAGHAAISRHGFIPDNVLQELGFHACLSSVEERPTDQVVRERYAGAGQWINTARKEEIIKVEKVKEKRRELGYVPKMSQLSTLIVYGLHFENPEILEKIFDADVLQAYRETEKELEKIENILPEKGDKESAVVKKAEQRYKQTFAKIWPYFKKLVEKDKKDQEMQEALKEMQEQEASGESGDKAPQKLKNKLTPKEQQELKEAIKKALEPALEGAEPVPVDLADLSETLKEKIKDYIESLTEEERAELEAKALQVLEDMEDKMTKKLEGILCQNPETHKDYKERNEKEGIEKSQKEVEKAKIEKELADISERVAATERENPDVYDNYYQQVRDLDSKLYKKLEEDVFNPNVKRKIKLKSTGLKPSLPAIFRWTASKQAKNLGIDNRIFESVKLPQKKDYALTLLVDLSGSMRNDKKIDETFKAAVLLAEVLNRLGVNFEILGFQDEVIIFKKSEEKLNDSVRKKMSGMIDEVHNKNPGGHNKARYNDDGPCLLEASKGLASQSAREKLLMIFSDGKPEGKRSGNQDLTDAVKEILTKTDQKLIGIGLNSDAVKDFYPVSLPGINVVQLAETLSDLLKDYFENPHKYSSKFEQE